MAIRRSQDAQAVQGAIQISNKASKENIKNI